MKKATFYTLVREDGENKAKKKTGYSFEKSGYTFCAYRYSTAHWIIIEKKSGLQVVQSPTLKEAADRITSHLLDMIDSVYKNITAKNSGLLADGVKLIGEAYKKDEETATETEKPARKPHNTIKRDTIHIVATIKKAVPHCEAGDRFWIVKDNRGRWYGTNERTGEKFFFTNKHLRDCELLDIVKQENASAYFKNLETIKEDFSRSEKETVDALRKIYHEKYDYLYDNEENEDAEKLDRLLVDGEILISGIAPEIISALCKAESNIFTSDRELRALAWAFGLYHTEKKEAAAVTDHKDEEKPADVLETETKKAPIQGGEKPTETRANIGKVWKPCTMSTRAYYGKIYSDNIRRNGTRKPAGILPTDASANLVKSFLSPSDIHTLTSIGLTDKKPAMGLVRSDNGTRSGRTTDTNRQVRNGETRTHGKVKPRGHPKNGITA